MKMIRQILNSWQENRGNLLVLLGSLAGLLMCLIWYFQLVPEVSLMARGIPGTLISTGPRPNSSSLVAILRSPVGQVSKINAATKTTSGDALQAIVEVYPPDDSFSQQVAPLITQSVKLRDDGVPVAVVFENLQPGRYSAVAYIDLNGSGSFDAYEAGTVGVTEPFCLARSLAPAAIDESVEPTPSSAGGDELMPSESSTSRASQLDPAASQELLPPGIFEVTAGQATLVVLEFD